MGDTMFGDLASVRDAVGFVDGEKGDPALSKAPPEVLIGETLWCDIKDFQFPGAHPAVDGVHFFRGEGGVEACCGNAAGDQSVDLVLHQGDERRNHEGQPVQQDRGKLVAEGLAAAGRKNG